MHSAWFTGGRLELNANPSTEGHITYEVATCKSWVMLDEPAPVPAPGRRLMAADAKPMINGTVTIWTYLNSNCSKYTGAEVGCCWMADDACGCEYETVQLLRNTKTAPSRVSSRPAAARK